MLRQAGTPLSRRVLGLAVAVACFCVAGVAARRTVGPTARAQELPDGQGRLATLRQCDTSCHGIDAFVDKRRSKARWLLTLDDMQRRGMFISDEDSKIVIGYLTAHLGFPVKINEATAKQIDDTLDLAPGQAEAIVKYRDLNGKFADWKDLLKVPTLDAKKLEEQKANIVF
jgi:competence ComEA-like helix-hairpin-helix protein